MKLVPGMRYLGPAFSSYVLPASHHEVCSLVLHVLSTMLWYLYTEPPKRRSSKHGLSLSPNKSLLLCSSPCICHHDEAQPFTGRSPFKMSTTEVGGTGLDS